MMEVGFHPSPMDLDYSLFSECVRCGTGGVQDYRFVILLPDLETWMVCCVCDGCSTRPFMDLMLDAMALWRHYAPDRPKWTAMIEKMRDELVPEPDWLMARTFLTCFGCEEMILPTGRYLQSANGPVCTHCATLSIPVKT